MNDHQKEINEFIEVINEDLMENYNVSSEEANSLIRNFKLQEIINEHGELITHYPTQELVRMIYEKKLIQKQGISFPKNRE